MIKGPMINFLKSKRREYKLFSIENKPDPNLKMKQNGQIWVFKIEQWCGENKESCSDEHYSHTK